MKILTRYILKEHVGPLVFALSALTAIMLLNQVARRFGDLVGKGLGARVIGEFFALSVPFIIAMTLPMAVLVSVLYAFSRLGSENEITALKASGVGISRLMLPPLVGAAFMALFMILFNDQILPRANHRLRALQTDIARTKPTFALREQVINEVTPGRLYLRAGRVDERSNRMRDVVIYDLSDPSRRRTIIADSGDMAMTPDRIDLELTLYNGLSRELPTDSPGEMQRLYFLTDVVRVRGVGSELQRSDGEGLKGDREMSICEMDRAYVQSMRQLAHAQAEVERALVGHVVRLSTGSDSIPAVDTTFRRPVSLSSTYCAIVQAIGPRRLQAQMPPPQRPAEERRQQQLRVPGALIEELVDPAALQPAEAIAPTIAANFAQPAAEAELLASRVTDAQYGVSRYLVEIHKKFALATACMVFVLLGAPIALRFPRGGVGMVIGASLIVFAGYYVGLIGGESLANRLIVRPALAMWISNVVFTLVGLYFLWKVRRAGGSARGGDMAEMLDSVRVGIAKLGRRIGLFADRRHRVA